LHRLLDDQEAKVPIQKLDKKKDKLAFYEMLLAQQKELGGYGHWARSFDYRCRKKGRISPLPKGTK
jgi:hypothetical protein